MILLAPASRTRSAAFRCRLVREAARSRRAQHRCARPATDVEHELIVSARPRRRGNRIDRDAVALHSCCQALRPPSRRVSEMGLSGCSLIAALRLPLQDRAGSRIILLRDLRRRWNAPMLPSPCSYVSSTSLSDAGILQQRLQERQSNSIVGTQQSFHDPQLRQAMVCIEGAALDRLRSIYAR